MKEINLPGSEEDEKATLKTASPRSNRRNSLKKKVSSAISNLPFLNRGRSHSEEGTASSASSSPVTSPKITQRNPTIEVSNQDSSFLEGNGSSTWAPSPISSPNSFVRVTQIIPVDPTANLPPGSFLVCASSSWDVKNHKVEVDKSWDAMKLKQKLVEMIGFQLDPEEFSLEWNLPLELVELNEGESIRCLEDEELITSYATEGSLLIHFSIHRTIIPIQLRLIDGDSNSVRLMSFESDFMVKDCKERLRKEYPPSGEEKRELYIERDENPMVKLEEDRTLQSYKFSRDDILLFADVKGWKENQKVSLNWKGEGEKSFLIQSDSGYTCKVEMDSKEKNVSTLIESFSEKEMEILGLSSKRNAQYKLYNGSKREKELDPTLTLLEAGLKSSQRLFVNAIVEQATEEMGSFILKPKVKTHSQVDLDAGFGVDPSCLPFEIDPSNGLIVPRTLVQLKRCMTAVDAFEVEGVFRMSGLESIMKRVVKGFNSKSERIESTVAIEDSHSLATITKRWFMYLPVKVLNGLPLHLIPLILNEKKDSNAVVQYLEEPYRSLFLWVIDLGARVILHSDRNKMNAKSFARVFSPSLLNISDQTAERGVVLTAQVTDLLESLFNQELDRLKQMNRPS
eukprot:TRINITY_DN373_c0_g1_i1.p1 TRINITY_DN373_c0_g1~~TRINITY_DN373_c0_g1_i1.p1  ORF type:complete len:625 (-),score=239.29 TRINITY_DN373_c0_g1_i1:58-1932(-)